MGELISEEIQIFFSLNSVSIILTFRNSSNMIDTAILTLAARTIRTAVINCVGGTIFWCGGFKDDLEPDSSMVVVQRVKLDTDNPITDHRVSTSWKRGLSTLCRQSRILQAGVAVLRRVIQDGESVVEAAFIDNCFNYCQLDISSMKSTYVPAAVKTSGVEGVWVVRRCYFLTGQRSMNKTISQV